MAKPPNQELINRLMAEMEEQREVIERAKDAGKIMRELNRMIAVLGGVPEEDVPQRRSWAKKRLPVVPPNENGKYECPECQREFVNPQGLALHRKMKHDVAGTYAEGRSK